MFRFSIIGLLSRISINGAMRVVIKFSLNPQSLITAN